MEKTKKICMRRKQRINRPREKRDETIEENEPKERWENQKWKERKNERK